MKPTNVSDFNRPTISIDLEILRNNNIIMVTIFVKAYLWATENCVQLQLLTKKCKFPNICHSFEIITELLNLNTSGMRNATLSQNVIVKRCKSHNALGQTRGFFIRTLQ